MVEEFVVLKVKLCKPVMSFKGTVIERELCMCKTALSNRPKYLFLQGILNVMCYFVAEGEQMLSKLCYFKVCLSFFKKKKTRTPYLNLIKDFLQQFSRHSSFIALVKQYCK